MGREFWILDFGFWIEECGGVGGCTARSRAPARRATSAINRQVPNVANALRSEFAIAALPNINPKSKIQNPK